LDSDVAKTTLGCLGAPVKVPVICLFLPGSVEPVDRLIETIDQAR
jgi:hypothetical protein